MKSSNTNPASSFPSTMEYVMQQLRKYVETVPDECLIFEDREVKGNPSRPYEVTIWTVHHPEYGRVLSVTLEESGNHLDFTFSTGIFSGYHAGIISTTSSDVIQEVAKAGEKMMQLVQTVLDDQRRKQLEQTSS